MKKQHLTKKNGLELIQGFFHFHSYFLFSTLTTSLKLASDYLFCLVYEKDSFSGDHKWHTVVNEIVLYIIITRFVMITTYCYQICIRLKSFK